MLIQLIYQFLADYCTEVREDEDSAYVELMMDNHNCIEFQDKQYYVPEDLGFTDENKVFMHEMLLATFKI